MLPAFGYSISREFTQIREWAEQTESKWKRLRKSKVEITGFVEARLRTVCMVVQRKVFTHSEAVIVNKKLKFSPRPPSGPFWLSYTHL